MYVYICVCVYISVCRIQQCRFELVNRNVLMSDHPLIINGKKKSKKLKVKKKNRERVMRERKNGSRKILKLSKRQVIVTDSAL